MAIPTIEDRAKEWVEVFLGKVDEGIGMTMHGPGECMDLAELLNALLTRIDNLENHTCCCCGDCH